MPRDRDPLDRACDILSRLGYEETAAELRDQVRELQGQVVQAQVDEIQRLALGAVAEAKRAKL